MHSSKDQAKANISNKFIGRGVLHSSTHQYAKDFGELANCGQYTATDMVFISSNGMRKGRLPPDEKEIRLAAESNCRFVIDARYHRNRAYNIGERETANLLSSLGYFELDRGLYSIWYKQ